MGYWDAMTSNLFGHRSEGLRVHMPNEILGEGDL